MFDYVKFEKDIVTHQYTEAFEEHCEQITESCKKALIQFRQSIKQTFPALLLTFNIRDYLDEEERIGFFEKINSSDAAEEYSEHIDEFA